MTGPERAGYGTGPVPPGAFAPRPERPAPPRKEDLAGLGRRVVALVVDGLIVGGLSLVVLAIIGAGFFSDGDTTFWDVVVGLLLWSVFVAVVAFVYAPLMMARTNGRTLGKMVAGCRVVRADGRPVSFGWAVLREVLVKGLLLGTVGSLTGGIGYLVDGLWVLVDGQNRALHDYVVDSRVVRA